MLELTTYLKERRERVDQFIDRHLPPPAERPAVLHEAMRYSTLAGGKRIRPILCTAAAEAVGGTFESALLPAAAIELLHTYTLIHDDLPCMDDDELRRGRPTCHVQFGEANAVLAGDALLTLAFEWISETPAPSRYLPTQLALELAHASGSRGVIAGQVEDLAGEGRELALEDLEFIHRRKTATLLRAAVRIGCIAGGGSPEELDALTQYGADIGLAFQIADDILNVTSNAETMGKPVGNDEKRKKSTYVRIHGLEKAKGVAHELIDQAVGQLATLSGDSEPLTALAHYIVQRQN
jgi:geranylgeranyl diphosphate synthase type II